MNAPRRLLLLADSSVIAALPSSLRTVSSAYYDSGSFARSQRRRQRQSEILLRGKQFGGEVEAVGRGRRGVGQRNHIGDLGQTRGHRRPRPCESTSRVQCQVLTLLDRRNQLPTELLGGAGYRGGGG